jgi:hypothetical protein
MPSLSGSNLVTDGAGYVVGDSRIEGRILDELLDGRWAVIGREDSLTDDDRHVLSRLDAVVIDDDGDIVIVRPDRIVFGTGRTALEALADVANRYSLAG